MGHLARDCRDQETQAELAEDGKAEQGEDFLFMVKEISERKKSTWYIDSGCSSHMSGDKGLFKELNEAHKNEITLGNNRKLQVEGKGTVAVQISQGKVKCIGNVLYAPELAHNLLSVGQLIKSGYAVHFEDGRCTIKEKGTGLIIVKVKMTDNCMFSLKFEEFEELTLLINEENSSGMWHHMYGHLNFAGLKLLKEKNMVGGLLKISLGNIICEGCIFGKQAK